MNEKEIAEIRRRFRPEKSSITRVRCCYVNDKKEIISQFSQSLAFTEAEESEQILGCLKRALSGTLGKNLIDLSFSTSQVVDSDEHRLLMALRDSSLADEEAVSSFYQRVIEALSLDSHYMILLAHDTYDVPYHGRDGETLEDASSEVYSYIVCSICPVKMTKPALSYFASDNLLHNRTADWILSAPQLGFLFPAFDDRCANLYGALYYTRDPAENHEEFTSSLFRCEMPMPAEEQRDTFCSVLESSLSDDCSYDVVQAVHEQLGTLMQEHKDSKQPEPLRLSANEMKHVLENCGATGEQAETFAQKYEEAFGADTALSPGNLIEKKTEIKTPDVTIQVGPNGGDLIETRVIHGIPYILVRANGNVTVNGVDIHIKEEV